MITINSHFVRSPSVKSKVQSRLKLHKHTLLYKLACLCYLLVVILLCTFFIVRAFKSKYRLDTDCYSSNWIDTFITCLTLTAIVLASALLVASLKYVSETENPTLLLEPAGQLDKTEDFIRRNSQQPSQVPVTINRTPSISSGSWLSAVRTEAYETHRRMSMAPVSSGAVFKGNGEGDKEVTLPPGTQ